MDTIIISSEIRAQLSSQELDDILAGAELFLAQSNDEDGVKAFVELSLLALGFEEGKRSN